MYSHGLCQDRVSLHGTGTPSTSVVTTTTLHFTSYFRDVTTGVIRAFVPFGNHLVGVWQNANNVVGSASTVQPTWSGFASSTEKLHWSNEFRDIGGSLGDAFKIVSIAQGVHTLSTMPALSRFDRIARGLFERNEIPTSHTVVTHNGRPDTTATALFYAQMSAVYDFIAEHAWYFLSPIWNGHTWNSMDQGLISGQHTINGLVSHYRSTMLRYFGLYLANRNAPLLRNGLNSFDVRANFMNTLFMATIANATCGVMSQIEAVPPTLADFSAELTAQSNATTDRFLRQVHGIAQQERDRTWEEYQNVSRVSFFGAPGEAAVVTDARARYHAASRAYEDASRAIGVQPTRTTTTSTSGSNDGNGGSGSGSNDGNGSSDGSGGRDDTGGTWDEYFF